MKTFREYLAETLQMQLSDVGGEQSLRDYIVKRKGFKYGDAVVRWFRLNPVVKRSEIIGYANRMFELFREYDNLKQTLKMVDPAFISTPAQIGGTTVNVNDIGSVKNAEIFKSLIEEMKKQALTHCGETRLKYMVKKKEAHNIRLLGQTEHVDLWATKTYDTTNKFVFHLWQNDRTLGDGDDYGDPKYQSPYCTHSVEHWKEYSHGNGKYAQFWFLKRPEGSVQANGDMSDANVRKEYDLIVGKGYELLICQNDTYGDLNDRNDKNMSGDYLDHENSIEYPEECVELTEKCLEEVPVQYNIGGHLIKGPEDEPPMYVPAGDDKNALAETCVGDLYVDRNKDIQNLVGMPKIVKGNIYLEYLPSLNSLSGLANSVNCLKLFKLPNLTTLENGQDCVVNDLLIIQNVSIKNLNGIPQPQTEETKLKIFDCQLFESFEGAEKWKTISISNCPKFKSLAELGDGVESIYVQDCYDLDLEGAPVVKNAEVFYAYGDSNEFILKRDTASMYHLWCHTMLNGTSSEKKYLSLYTDKNGRFTLKNEDISRISERIADFSTEFRNNR